VPWVVPHEFFDSLPPWQEIPLAANVYAPQGMPDAAWHFPADVTEMVIAFNGTCNATRSRLYRRAYYAATAYQDHNIGAVLSELDKLQLTDSTLVVMIGDHGWNLGEHDLWAKFNIFETGAHIPLIIRAPWMPRSVGQHTDVLAGVLPDL
jgi:membrane-anchored protein YejM (alkaline phosphatase superfamily)